MLILLGGPYFLLGMRKQEDRRLSCHILVSYHLPSLQILLVAAVVDFVIALGSGEEGLRYVCSLLCCEISGFTIQTNNKSSSLACMPPSLTPGGCLTVWVLRCKSLADGTCMKVSPSSVQLVPLSSVYKRNAQLCATRISLCVGQNCCEV